MLRIVSIHRAAGVENPQAEACAMKQAPDKSDLFCHSERSEESLLVLNSG
jgi:hypothetical protein